MKKTRIELDRIPPFSGIPARKRKEMESSATKLELRSRERLFDTGSASNRVYVLVSGGLKLQRRGPGRRTYVADFVAPGTLFGHIDCLVGKSRAERCTAIQESTLLSWTAQEFMSAVESNTAGTKAFVRLLAQRLNTDLDRAEEQAIANLRTRLIRLIHRLAKDFGQKTKGGTLINLKVTHQDMADHLGASRESVTVTISSLRRQRLIRLDVRRIIVPDLRQLLKA